MNPLRVQDVHHASLRCVQHGCVASMNAQPAAVCLKRGCLSRDYVEAADAPLPVDGPVEELEKRGSPE